MNIYFVIPYVPNRIRVRPYNIIKSVARRGHRISLYTLWSNDEERDDLEDISQYCQSVFSWRLSRSQAAWNALQSLPTKQPLQSMYCWQPQLYDRLLADIQENPPDVIHVEHMRGSCYGFQLLEDLDAKELHIPVVWDSVDSITYLFRQAIERKQTIVQKFILALELPRTRVYEYTALKSYEQILVTSRNDRQEFLSLCEVESNCAEVQVVPNGVDLDYFKPAQQVKRADCKLVVSGKMSYHANKNMVENLISQIMPHVWSQHPDVELWVVGKDPPQSFKEYSRHKNITVTGTVPDVRPYLREATVALAPIAYGAGIQNKVLEAMACGTPVVATSQAVSALQVEAGVHLLVADKPDEFAKRVVELIENPVKRVEMGIAARQYVEDWHDWLKIAALLEKIYLPSPVEVLL